MVRPAHDAPPGTSIADCTIGLRVERIQQLFDTLDPFPFPDRDLDPHAEEFLVDWARELPRGRPLRVSIHLPEEQARSPEAAALPEPSGISSPIAPQPSRAISKGAVRAAAPPSRP